MGADVIAFVLFLIATILFAIDGLSNKGVTQLSAIGLGLVAGAWAILEFKPAFR